MNNNYIQYFESVVHGKDNFPFNIYICTIPSDFPKINMHWHHQFEFIVIKKGEGIVAVDEDVYRVKEGDIVSVLPGQVHAIEAEVHMEYENIIFSLDILESLQEDAYIREKIFMPLKTGSVSIPNPICASLPYYEDIMTSIQAIDAVSDRNSPCAPLLIKANLLTLFFTLSTHFKTPLPSYKGPYAKPVKDALQYIHDHYREKISLREVADISGFSLVHFMRIFKSAVGDTFLHTLNDYRLDTACYLLKNTDDSISDVAMKCGFDNLSYFIRLFEKRYKMTPGKFRRNQTS